MSNDIEDSILSEDDSRAAAARYAERVIESCTLRRGKGRVRDATKIPKAWRYSREEQRIDHDFKQELHFRFSERDFTAFRLWGEELGFVHEDDPDMLRKVVREIAAGRIALVRFEDEEEYLSVLKLLSYVRKTFYAIRRPASDAALMLCRSLGRLRHIQWHLSHPSTPIQIARNDDDGKG
jgi:hypothetical protein